MYTKINLLKNYRFPNLLWRMGSKSKDGTKCNMLVYADARDYMEALDKIIGESNWKKTYTIIGEYIICSIHFRTDNNNWIEFMQDGADRTEIEEIKGGLSDAFKRCCMALGLGRYLYEAKNINTWININDIHNVVVLEKLNKKLISHLEDKEWKESSISKDILDICGIKYK